METARTRPIVVSRRLSLGVVIPALLALVGLGKLLAAVVALTGADTSAERTTAIYHGVAALLAVVVLGGYALRRSRDAN